MKPNQNQKELINLMASQMDFWLHTNDITSPTHIIDISEEINKFSLFNEHVDSNLLSEVKNHLECLYMLIRKLDNGS